MGFGQVSATERTEKTKSDKKNGTVVAESSKQTETTKGEEKKNKLRVCWRARKNRKDEMKKE